MADLRQFHGPNAGYVLELQERYQRDPASVEEAWRDFFEALPAGVVTGAEPTGAPVTADLRIILGAHDLAQAIRERGHTAARLSPLADAPPGDPSLRPEAHGITEDLLGGLPAELVSGPASAGSATAAEAISRLRSLYAGSLGFEIGHVVDAEERQWLADAIECERFRPEIDADRARRLLERLTEVEGMEQYLHRAFFGQKRFSVEGTDMLVPLLDELVDTAAEDGLSEALIGMAHRGRLNVLANFMRKPYAQILAGFTGHKPAGPAHLTGDVKYHLGWEGTHETPAGREVRLRLAPNPSHLEFVSPVVLGMTRAVQDDTHHDGYPALEHETALAILVHGDAAFPGQGVVAETLNLAGLDGYTVGGAVHVIVNNQIGFTTDVPQARSTRYASDLAKGFEVPVVHVNADDPEACIQAARLAAAYRGRFHKDFVIDLVGYRRWGHNEGDEPAFTQPRMYERITSHPTVRQIWADTAVERGHLEEDEPAEMLDTFQERLASEQAAVEAGEADLLATPSANGRDQPSADDTPRDLPSADADALRGINEALLDWPEDFTPHRRLGKLIQRRREMLEEGTIDWGHAETLAFATLLRAGIPIRLTGQDAERGTFSHRHVVLHDGERGTRHVPLHHLEDIGATFEVRNSPLSEMAAVGFEYGYSVQDEDVLVLWEAQFGDFVNGAQVMLDQFISSGRAKWGQDSGMVMLLPHGYEGQGPEHSSARLERFLQLAAEENLQVANCTTSSQYYHLLRRQASQLGHQPRPLVVMSPKSLLRHPLASSTLEQLAGDTFQPVLGDDAAADRADEVTRLLLCSGKVYVDLAGSDAREKATRVALARVEMLYPFPREELSALIASFPALKEVVWVQEEPRNMGAWTFVAPRLRTLLLEGASLSYSGRPERASPAEGDARAHQKEQSRIVEEAWSGAPAAKKSPARSRT
jgi:2-oxoglutarate dehydrogenase E1 component